MNKVLASKHFWLLVSVVWILIVVASPLDDLLMLMLVPSFLMVVWAWLPNSWKSSKLGNRHH